MRHRSHIFIDLFHFLRIMSCEIVFHIIHDVIQCAPIPLLLSAFYSLVPFKIIFRFFHTSNWVECNSSEWKLQNILLNTRFYRMSNVWHVILYRFDQSKKWSTRGSLIGFDLMLLLFCATVTAFAVIVNIPIPISGFRLAICYGVC